jgi:hypothetical protein
VAKFFFGSLSIFGFFGILVVMALGFPLFGWGITD